MFDGDDWGIPGLEIVETLRPAGPPAQNAEDFPERITTPLTSLPRSHWLNAVSSAMAAFENTFIGRPGMSNTRCRTLRSDRSARNCCNFPNSDMAFSAVADGAIAYRISVY